MEKKTLTAGFCVLFLVLFLAQEHGAEGKVCLNLSDKYKGPCLTTQSCDHHCRDIEHLLSGVCRDDFRCWCNRNC
ncbi:hypothetical protein PIB30_007148 [Stylosanthes scabra]|uniref:Knottins-like domain-containing protein n=1 Tax=Stylosanthes scabra TaxID=79078 RepID=A0ABU6T4C1_9FABA|nr:hypothetical protein [Stylosanthes scabra]